MRINRIDHVGIVVNDLSAAKEFFLDFGLEMVGEGEVKGEWVEKIIGLQDVKEEIAMLRIPGGGTNIELIKFYNPIDEEGVRTPSANTLGIRHVAFAVEGLEGLVTKMEKKGASLAGEIQNYKDAYKLCYLRGPEGIILELTERIKNS